MCSLVVVVLALVAVAVAKDGFSTKYDNIDVDAIIKNDRLINNYFNCLMERGTCTPDGLEAKKNLPDALETDCSKCNRKQKEMITKILKYLINNKKDLYSELEAKYDPEAKYRSKFTEQFKS